MLFLVLSAIKKRNKMFVKDRELKASMCFCNIFKNSSFNQFSSGQHYQTARGYFCNTAFN